MPHIILQLVSLVLTIPNHGLVNGDAVVLDTGSICFMCDKGSYTTVHCYPRATDPAANKYLTVTNELQIHLELMLVHLIQVMFMLMYLILLLLIQFKQSVVVDMLELQQLSSKTTKDHYLLLV